MTLPELKIVLDLKPLRKTQRVPALLARPTLAPQSSLPAAHEVFVTPVMVVAVVIIIRARRTDAYADTSRPRIETNLCRGRQSRADRYRRHKRNSKLPHDCLLCGYAL